MKTSIQPKKSSRILALDILRGITIAGMILVNNPGSWSSVYAPLQHASWDGLTPTDLVFPFFMFIMGISTYISMSRTNFELSTPLLFKVIKRTFIIFAIGIGLAWLSLSMSTYHKLAPENLDLLTRLGQSFTNFKTLRIMGVLQRLALTYGFTAIIAMLVKHKYIPYLIGSMLLAYFLILLFGNGFVAEDNKESIVYIFDSAILGASHMYGGGSIIEPEGLLSTLPAIAHVLIGFLCGRYIVEIKDNHQRIEKLFIVGTILTFCGFLLAYGCPINKKLWSPTYVLVTCGLASLLLGLLIWIIDIKGRKKWSVFFESFGINPLFIYVFAGVFATVLSDTRVPYNEGYASLKTVIWKSVLTPYIDNAYFASLIFALLFVGVCWLVGYVLYKKRIYIKI